MLTISKPLSSAQVRTYHAEEFSNAAQNYYTTGDQIRGHDADFGIMPRVSCAHEAGAVKRLPRPA